ncbi:MAG: DUF2946 domain-containing protein, partial [Dokdonella sp.]
LIAVVCGASRMEQSTLSKSPHAIGFRRRYPAGMIRTSKKRRTLAWVGLLAILLVALVPTISQLRAASGGDRGALVGLAGLHAGHDMAAMSGEPAWSHDHDKSGKSGEDCWKKCGYCGFLGHAPVMGGFAYLAAFPAPVAASTPDRSIRVRAHIAHDLAGQPRGPPQLS